VRKLVKLLLAAAAIGFGFLAYVYLTLPNVAELGATNPPTTAFMELRADEARARNVPPRRVQRWVPYSRISSSLKRAVLVAEDGTFWEHDGIDVTQIKESIERDLQKRTFGRGGSTITQQLAKNLYLSPSKNPVRKLRELLIARRMEASLTKTRIFEIYLNVIEWGDGIYGADAAARVYFRKPAADGPFEVFSDLDSRISHYQRILTMFASVTAALLPITAVNVVNVTRSGSSLAFVLPLFVIYFALVATLATQTIRLSRRVRELREQKRVYE